MKGLRSFLILVVVAAALGGYLYYDSKHASSDEKKQDKVFTDVKAESIDRITVKSDKGETTTAAKQGDKWQETQPAATRSRRAARGRVMTSRRRTAVDGSPSGVYRGFAP